MNDEDQTEYCCCDGHSLCSQNKLAYILDQCTPCDIFFNVKLSESKYPSECFISTINQPMIDSPLVSSIGYNFSFIVNSIPSQVSHSISTYMQVTNWIRVQCILVAYYIYSCTLLCYTVLYHAVYRNMHSEPTITQYHTPWNPHHTLWNSHHHPPHTIPHHPTKHGSTVPQPMHVRVPYTTMLLLIG